MTRAQTIFLTLAALGLPSTALAEAPKTLDVGVLKDSDVKVVQKLLYPKEGRVELGFHAGWMPFDAYTTTPVGAVSGGYHLSEMFGIELALTGGYSLKNSTYKELEGPAYGVAPDAYRFLGSVLADVQWSPIYAKFNWMGNGVIHHDVYFLGGVGGTFEQAMLPDNSSVVAPTVGIGAGARVFLGNGALRFQVRDDILREKRVKTLDTKGWFIKQNVAITVGYSMMLGGK